MNYFKIIHKQTDTVMCYGCTEESIDYLCEIFGDEYTAVAITKEEYEFEIGKVGEQE